MGRSIEVVVAVIFLDVRESHWRTVMCYVWWGEVVFIRELGAPHFCLIPLQIPESLAGRKERMVPAK